MRVQVPSPAPKKKSRIAALFLWCNYSIKGLEPVRVWAWRKQSGGLFLARSGETGTVAKRRSASHKYARRSRSIRQVPSPAPEIISFCLRQKEIISTKSVLTDGINPPLVDEITMWWNPTSSEERDGFNFIHAVDFICEADFILAPPRVSLYYYFEVIWWQITSLQICQQILL